MFVRSPLNTANYCYTHSSPDQQREKEVARFEQSNSCQNYKNSSKTVPIQSPTISNSERAPYRSGTGSRKIEKGERERKRVADIKAKVDVLRQRIDPEFLKGYSSKKPTRLQTLKTAICYICSLSKYIQGDIWDCRCVHMGMEHRQITRITRPLTLPSSSTTTRRNMTLQSYERPHNLSRPLPHSLAYTHVHF